MNPELQSVVEVLRTVKDPVTGQDLIRLRMVRDLKVEGRQLHFKIFLPSGSYGHKDSLYADLHEKLHARFPTYEVHAHFVNQAPYADAPNTLLPQISNFIAVASGKGGVGKSTISVSLAVALQSEGFKVGLMDADLYGPSIPTMLGIREQKPQVVESQGQHKMVPIDVQGLQVVSLGNIIDADQAVVLRGPRLAAIIKQFFFDTAWPELDFLIIDLPPGTGDVQLTLVQTIPLTGVVMVTTPQEVAYIDAVKAANMFEMDQIKVPILGIIENMSWFEPEDQPDKKYHIFGKGGGQRLADKCHSTLLGQVPIREQLRNAFDQGRALQMDPYYAKLFKPIVQNLNESVELRHMILAPTQTVSAS